MKKNLNYFIITLMFLILYSIAFYFNTTEVHAIGFTDIENVNDDFLFSENNAYDDMDFRGAVNPETDGFWNQIYEKYRLLIILVSGILSLGFIGLFIINITKYGTSSANASSRSQAIKTLLWTGIAAALFSIVTLLTALSYSFFIT